jgi:hypothetical protein
MTDFQDCIAECPSDPAGCRETLGSDIAACEEQRSAELAAGFELCRDGQTPQCGSSPTSDASNADVQPSGDGGLPDAGPSDTNPSDASPSDAASPDAGGNQAPIANAGPDQTVSPGQTATLNGSGSDPDGDVITYQWTVIDQPPGSSLSLSDAQQASASLTAFAVGAYTVELTVDDGSLSATDTTVVTITDDDPPPSQDPCLLISEYVEGSSNNKAFEIFNCGSAPIDLSEIGYCGAANEGTPTTEPCRYNFILTGSLAANDVHVVCHPSFSTLSLCDETTSQIQFNGDDRIAIYRDENTSAGFEYGTDTIMDAFGRLDDQPLDLRWGEKTLRRCNFTHYDGVSSFAYLDFYTEHLQDTVSGLGQPPSETCAP